MLTRSQITELRRRPVSGRNRLAAALELAERTQVQLAEAIGVTQANISRLCTGSYSDLPLEKTRAIAEFFGCSIEDLFPAKATEA